jgi:hypothetical protein
VLRILAKGLGKHLGKGKSSRGLLAEEPAASPKGREGVNQEIYREGSQELPLPALVFQGREKNLQVFSWG